MSTPENCTGANIKRQKCPLHNIAPWAHANVIHFKSKPIIQ